MEETGQKPDLTHSLRALLEQHLEDGRQSTNALVALMWEPCLTISREDKQSITSALVALTRFQRKMFKSIT